MEKARQNDVDGSLIQTIYRRGSVLKEILKGDFFRVSSFLVAEPLFRHHCWRDTPKGYANTTSEIHACGFHHSCWREIPMHASSIHAPHPMCSHQHACHGIPMHVLRQSLWQDSHDPCGCASPSDGTVMILCGSVIPSGEILVIYMRKLERKTRLCFV